MGSYPNPDVTGIIFRSESTVVEAYSSRPIFANWFELHRRMMFILLEKREVFSR